LAGGVRLGQIFLLEQPRRRVRLEVFGLGFGLPGLRVRAEDLRRLAVLGQHLVLGKNHLVLERLELGPGLFGELGYGRVAGGGVGLVVLVGVDGGYIVVF
jgi:hypothetical protein